MTGERLWREPWVAHVSVEAGRIENAAVTVQTILNSVPSKEPGAAQTPAGGATTTTVS